MERGDDLFDQLLGRELELYLESPSETVPKPVVWPPVETVSLAFIMMGSGTEGYALGSPTSGTWRLVPV